MDIYVKKNSAKDHNCLWGLSPADQDSLDYVKKLSKTDVYKVTVKKARNYELLKKFFALIKAGHDNTKLDLPIDIYRKVMIMRAGYFKSYNTGKGTHFEADSISFANKSEDEFQQIYKRVLEKVANDIGLSDEDLEIEVLTRF